MNKHIRTLLLSIIWLASLAGSGFGESVKSPQTQPAPREVSAITDVRWKDGICPICDKKVSLAMISPLGVNAGVDHDLFERALGPQPEFYLINTCPNCHFSGYLTDFELVLIPGDRERIKQRLKPLKFIDPNAKPQEIETLDKYDLAWQTFKILDRSDEAMGWLALRASWVCRDQYCNLPRDPLLSRVFREAGELVPAPDEKTNPADRELAQADKLAEKFNNTTTAKQDRWAYNAAIGLLYRRHGENSRALPYFESALADKQTPRPVVKSIQQMKKSINDELAWQQRAAESFRQAMDDRKINRENQSIAVYLLGQLYHRLGKKDRAKRWLKKAMLDPELPPTLIEWARTTRE
jgi:uncharacterized protein (DUF2225 family)